jgi:hypothetical protein
MSTDYVLIENSEGSVEVWEHSCKFDITVLEGKIEPHYCVLRDLSLEQIKEVNQQLTNVISYFDPDYEECKVDYS